MTDSSFAFWKGKRVFLTGHSGFKGGWLSVILTELGARVCGYSLEPITDPNLHSSLRSSLNLINIYGDIRNQRLVTESLANFEPEIIIHMAAQPLVIDSYLKPVDTFDTNVMGLVSLLEAARRCNALRAIINVTSDKCYENRGWVWGYREQDRLGGFDPYSTSKACAELVTSSYRRSYFWPRGVAVATARAGNVIGGGDWSADRLVPDIVRAVVASGEVKLRNPQAIRPWQHVIEPLFGYLLLVERMYDCKDFTELTSAWNFGPDLNVDLTVRQLTEKLLHGLGVQSRCTLDTVESSNIETQILRLDSSKARELLGWRPRLTPSTVLEMTAEWYRRFYEGTCPLSLCAEQLGVYRDLISTES